MKRSSCDSSSDSGLFEVEKILRMKIDKQGETKYFVKWAGYSDKHNSWEPELNLKHSQDLLKEFKRDLNKTKEGNIKEDVPCKIMKIDTANDTLECEIKWANKNLANSLVKFDMLELLAPLLITRFLKELIIQDKI